MRILLAVHHFPPTHRAGGELQAYHTALELLQRGHEVRVVCVESIDDRTAAPLAWEDGVLDGIPVRRLRYDLASAPNPDRFEYDNLWIGEHLRGLMRTFKPDLFHLYGGYLIGARPLRVAAEENVPTAVTLLEFWFLCRRLTMMRPSGGISRLPLDPVACAGCWAESQRRYRLPASVAPELMHRYWAMQSARVEAAAGRARYLHERLAAADVIISQSRFVHQMFVEAGIPEERMVFCRQGQAATAFGSPTPRPPGPLRLGYLGQVAEHKGIHIALEALRMLPGADVTFTVYGDATMQPGYTRKLHALARNDKRIHFAGRYNRAELPRVMETLDVLIVPSLWYENSPNVIFEAHGYQRPVIASRFGGMAELVEHGRSGLLFNVGDAADLAAQIRRLTTEPALFDQLCAGIPAPRTLAQEIDELEAIYGRIVRREDAGEASTPLLAERNAP